MLQYEVVEEKGCRRTMCTCSGGIDVPDCIAALAATSFTAAVVLGRDSVAAVLSEVMCVAAVDEDDDVKAVD
jgi:hypothetical protein